MSTHTRRPRTVLLALGLVAAVLGTHLAVTALYVAPPNPLKYALQRPVNAWIQPFFEQNWQLFAPDPVRTDSGVLVRATTRDGEDTDFLTINAPYLEARHHNPLPDRSYYTVSGVMHAFLMSRDAAVEAAYPADPPADLPILLPDDELADVPAHTREAYEDTLRNLHDAAADAARRTWGDVTRIQVRLVTHEFPRWSQRHDDGLGEISHVTLPWRDLPTPTTSSAAAHGVTDPTGDRR
ncbi:DUF5819 family protein [Cellulomonas uda]|uniref:Uncharacterized protein n=1 Tax=Cellulomonas uda TaxID=1714 RepID=A0A4Y3KFT7_CELUD|nr:DUF5819 family protein [Cellulomonas uda]NII66266.1 hypothetical protein [Cellulomonas uda]GEA81925.1 hypothetical protein CUD01_23690 [Cellulomonas uda]